MTYIFQQAFPENLLEKDVIQKYFLLFNLYLLATKLLIRFFWFSSYSKN